MMDGLAGGDPASTKGVLDRDRERISGRPDALARSGKKGCHRPAASDTGRRFHGGGASRGVRRFDAARPPRGKDAHRYVKELGSKSIAITAREGFLRFSPHVGNDEEEAERALAALRDVL